MSTAEALAPAGGASRSVQKDNRLHRNANPFQGLDRRLISINGRSPLRQPPPHHHLRPGAVITIYLTSTLEKLQLLLVQLPL